ncbi:hypothetical protein PsYK624_004000 [Phanerochaete sordida]|uniref:Uncharacterized protein n=1 Tax=Phanerochaete sordida TaxID=48140 RepID=A0A9P3L7B5_9APHY|nr:hypothetical protein PsYK624_004000 [Phanerochaete sordida]
MDGLSEDESPLPRLPAELLIPIFEATCLESHEAALRISLVCSWVRDLAKPYVFGTVIRKAGSLYPIKGHVELSHKNAPPGCGDFVRHLWLETVDVLSSPREMGLFKSCPNVEDIALSVNPLRTLLAMYASPYSSPKASAIRTLTLLNPTPRTVWAVTPGALLRGITHLRMIDLQHTSYVPLEHLPALTHLAVPLVHLRTTYTDSFLAENITKSRRLQMVVLTVDHYDWIYRPWLHRDRYTTTAFAKAETPRAGFRLVWEATRKRDQRAHVILSPTMGPGETHVTVCAEWSAAARGSESIWEKAARVAPDNAEDLNALPTVYPKPRTYAL